MPISRKLALDDAQVEELMTTTWNCRIATLGPGDRINLTPMWFSWAGGRVYLYGRGQKVVNLRRNPACSIVVDRNERFPELQAVTMQGTATVLEDADAEAADPHLEEARVHFGSKYNGGPRPARRGRPAAQYGDGAGRERTLDGVHAREAGDLGQLQAGRTISAPPAAP